MPQRAVKVVKKSEVERRREEERRAEIQMLRIFVFRYPEKAKEFLEKRREISIDNRLYLD